MPEEKIYDLEERTAIFAERVRDFLMKIKTCRREAKESSYWLRLVITDKTEEMEKDRIDLRQEPREFVLIFTAILRKRGA